MADLEGVKVAKSYAVTHTGIDHLVQVVDARELPVRADECLNWKSGNTVMFAFDHGYFMGSTAGLERLDLLLPKLAASLKNRSVRAMSLPTAHTPRVGTL